MEAGVRRAAGERSRAANVKQLATVERDLVRLTAAVTAGGELDTLVAAIKEREKAREALRLELRSLERAGRAATLDLPAVERQLRAKLDEWKAVLRKHVPQARQVLKKLLAGPWSSRRTARQGSATTSSLRRLRSVGLSAG